MHRYNNYYPSIALTGMSCLLSLVIANQTPPSSFFMLHADFSMEYKKIWDWVVDNNNIIIITMEPLLKSWR